MSPNCALLAILYYIYEPNLNSTDTSWTSLVERDECSKWYAAAFMSAKLKLKLFLMDNKPNLFDNAANAKAPSSPSTKDHHGHIWATGQSLQRHEELRFIFERN